MNTNYIKLSFATTLLLALIAGPALALPVSVVHENTPDCDPLFIPDNGVHELGELSGGFPVDESLAAFDQGPHPDAPCPAKNDDMIPEALVEMRNTSGLDWQEVWYVANEKTTITNFDGEANEVPHSPLREAFRLDHDASDPGGTHHPLIFESMSFDGVWQAGETWRFILQDYTNSLGLPPDAINSIGVGDASKAGASGVVTSSGSIIAIRVPEPSACVLGGLAIAVAALRRRNRRD